MVRQTSVPAINEDSYSRAVINHCSLRCLIFMCKQRALTLIKGKGRSASLAWQPPLGSVLPGVRNYINMSPSPTLYLFLSCRCISSVLTPHAFFRFYSSLIRICAAQMTAPDTHIQGPNVYNIAQI